MEDAIRRRARRNAVIFALSFFLLKRPDFDEAAKHLLDAPHGDDRFEQMRYMVKTTLKIGLCLGFALGYLVAFVVGVMT